jgi:ABC-2 type transport system ATP-binding protein
MTQSAAVIEVNSLVVEYGKGGRKLRAVDGISFQVSPGEVVGFIGANGAGKSTTIKSMMGFIFPSSGSIRVFGLPPGDVRSRERTGYLPEVALYYPFMKARELLELYGGLHGLSKSQLKRRIPEILSKVGLDGKGEVLLKNYSKGMQQRLGIAQSLVSDPELLIFDELSSGLDPLGRHDLRQVLFDLKQAGRTIFFSSHELGEVETLCDRVIMIHKGRLLKQCNLEELMQPLNEFEILFRLPEGVDLPADIAALKPAPDGEALYLVLNRVEDYSRVLSQLARLEAQILRSTSRTRSLEEYFIEMVGEKEPVS